MKLSHNIFISVLTIGVAVSIGAGGVWADNFSATDKELKISMPVLTNTLPIQLGSSFSTQYATDRTPDPSAGMLHLQTVIFEQGIRYPSLWSELSWGNSVGEKLNPEVSDRFSMANPNSAYVTSWLTKQWASVDLSLSQTHLIETPNNQLTVGVSRAIYLIQNKVTVNIGEHLWTDLENRLWSRTTDVSMDYGWKSWDLSLSIEHREDPRVNTQSIWTAVKTKF